jgi:hypothetical protein
MDTSPQISSLYGPGAFAGWLCTAVSVFISWTWNRDSSTRDTIGNDLIATLTIPAIAAIHHVYELRKSTRGNGEPATETLKATYCFVTWFLFVGVSLLGLSTLTGRLKRWICSEIVLVLCLSVSFVVSWRNDAPTSYPALYVAFVLLAFGVVNSGLCSLVPYGMHLNDCERQAKLDARRQRQTGASSICSFRARNKDHRLRSYHALRNLVLCSLSTVSCLLVALCGFILCLQTRKGQIDSNFSVPQTGYSVAELDQAVALSAGVLTLICTICDAHSSRQLSAWEEYQEWRSSCENLLDEGVLDEEEGVLNEDEALKEKRELENIVQREEEILSAPARTGLLATMLRRKKEREEEKLAYRLAQSGLL